jgi:hypothetical protein
MTCSPVLDQLANIASQVPPRQLRETVEYFAPGSRPGQMNMSQIARCLGVQGVAQAWQVPYVVLLRRLGPERCAVEDLIRPNPYAANGDDARRMAYSPACSCQRNTMGDIVDDIISGDDPPPATVGPDGWPAAPAFRGGNWNFETCTYTLAQGDTLSGLARLYLGRPDRWLEIWQLQPFRFTYKPDPSSKNPGRAIREGDPFIMPKEACERAKLMIKEGKPSAPATGGAPGTLPGESEGGLHKSAPTTDAEKKKLLMYGGAALAAVVVIGGVAYAVS